MVNKCVYVHTIYYLPLIFCLNKCKFHADRYLDSWIASFKLRGEDCPLLSFLWRVALEGSLPLAHQPAEGEGAGPCPSGDTRVCEGAWLGDGAAGQGAGRASHGMLATDPTPSERVGVAVPGGPVNRASFSLREDLRKDRTRFVSAQRVFMG